MSANVRRQQGTYELGEPLGLQYTKEVADRLKGRLPKDAYGMRAYDRKLLKGGAATTTNPFRFFTVPVGQQDFVLNAAAEPYAKTDWHTSMNTAALLEQGQMLIVTSIQIMITIPSQTDTAYPTSGPGTEQTTNPTAAAGVSGVNLTTAILDQTFFKFTVAEHDYEQGLGWMFPSKYGMSGFAGFGITTDFEGVSNNGFGREWQMPMWRQIPALTSFYVQGAFLQAMTITRNCAITCILEGIKYRPVA